MACQCLLLRVGAGTPGGLLVCVFHPQLSAFVCPRKPAGFFPSPSCRPLLGHGRLVLGKGRISVIWAQPQSLEGPVCLGFLRVLPSPCSIQSLPCVCGPGGAEVPARPQ